MGDLGKVFSTRRMASIVLTRTYADSIAIFSMVVHGEVNVTLRNIQILQSTHLDSFSSNLPKYSIVRSPFFSVWNPHIFVTQGLMPSFGNLAQLLKIPPFAR